MIIINPAGYFLARNKTVMKSQQQKQKILIKYTDLVFVLHM